MAISDADTHRGLPCQEYSVSLSIIKFSYKISKQSNKQCEKLPLLGHRRMSKNVGSDCQGSS